MYLIKRLLFVVMMTFVGVSGYMALFEDQFIYFSSRDVQATPADYGMTFEELLVGTEDGITLHGWYMPEPLSHFTVLHFHGNAGNISHRLSLYKAWQSLGLSVYAFDYRGYGKSEGTPGEAGLYADARAVWSDLTIRLGVKPQHVIIAGRSLGAAVAAKLASEVNAAGVVLETPFSSIPDMAALHYPWLPVRWLARTNFDTESMVRDVHMPLLMIAARDDAISPAQMADSIFAAANAPKTKVELPGGHNDFDHYSSMAYGEAWREWIAMLGRRDGSAVPER
jgi:pimeloyl-ACP methyl ester carboxylesterase